MHEPAFSARLQSMCLRITAAFKATPSRRRRGGDNGTAPVPVDPAPKPLPMTGGAEATID